MGKTINYQTASAKHAPRLFVIEEFNEKGGFWQITAQGRKQGKMETLLRNMRTDQKIVRMIQG